MACSLCDDDCVGKEEFNKKDLDIEVRYRAGDCKINTQNTPWWVEIKIDSARGNSKTGTGGVDVRAEIDTGPEIEITDNNRDSVYVPGNSSDRFLEFKIKQKNNSNPPKREDVDLDLEYKETGTFEDLKEVHIQRTLSGNP